MSRRRLWRALNRQKAVYRRSAKGIFMKAFDKEITPLYNTIEHASDIRDIEVPELDDLAIFDAYRKLYMSVSLDYAMRARKGNKKMAKSEDDIYEDLITQEILSYISTDMGSTIVAVGDTSKVLLQKLLKELVPEILDSGAGGGAATTMLRDRIASQWHEMKYYRTERIARTEVNRASNFGSLKGMQTVDEQQDKVWISSFSPESRDTHMAADGQTVDINEPFNVGGEDLMYPCDPAGSAGNTVNCLCDVYYKVKK